MREARRTNLALVGTIGAIGDEEDGKFTLGSLHGRVGLSRRHVIALGVELEVVDQRLHRTLHLAAPGRGNLLILHHHRALRHLFDALPDDAHRLAHFLHAHEIAIEAVTTLAYRDLEIEFIVDLVRLRPPKIPGYAGGTQHRA